MAEISEEERIDFNRILREVGREKEVLVKEFGVNDFGNPPYMMGFTDPEIGFVTSPLITDYFENKDEDQLKEKISEAIEDIKSQINTLKNKE